jgi:hypothetical protein
MIIWYGKCHATKYAPLPRDTFPQKNEQARPPLMRWAGACSAYDGEERRERILVGKPEGEKPVGRPKRRWEDNTVLIWNYRKWDVGYGLD